MTGPRLPALVIFVATLISASAVPAAPDEKGGADPAPEPLARWGRPEDPRDGAVGELSAALSVAFDAEGNSYVVDEIHPGQPSQVRVYDPTGAYLRSIGRTDGGPGTLVNPHAVAVGPDDRVYVTTENRVQVLQTDGTFEASWAAQGPGAGDVENFTGVAVTPGGDVVVSDFPGRQVLTFSPDGTQIDSWRLESEPYNLALGPDASLYVFGVRGWVWRYTLDGTLLASWVAVGTGTNQEFRAGGVAVDGDGRVYVTDHDRDRVLVTDSNGAPLGAWTTDPEFERRRLDNPVGLAIDRDGNVVVALSAGAGVASYTPSGVLVDRWGTSTPGPEEFREIRDVEIGRSGDVYVLDSRLARVQHFTIDGQFVGVWGTAGLDPGELRAPGDLAIDANGRVFVVDSGNRTVQVFTANGRLRWAFGQNGNSPGQFLRPRSLALGRHGHVLVLDPSREKVLEFSAHGGFIREWTIRVPGSRTVIQPQNITVGRNWQIYVPDLATRRVLRFSPTGRPLRPFTANQPGDHGGRGTPGPAATDASGIVYLVDRNRIERYSPTGGFLGASTVLGSGVELSAIDVDQAGRVVVGDDAGPSGPRKEVLVYAPLAG